MPVLRRIWPPALVALGGVGLVACVGFTFGGQPEPGHTPYGVLAWTLFAVLPMYAVAVFLLLHRADHPGARLVMVVGATGAIGMGLEAAIRYAYHAVGPGDWLWAANLGYGLCAAATTCAMTALFGYFPDGVPERRRHAVAVRVACGLMLAAPVLALLSSPRLLIDKYLLDPVPDLPNPAAVPWLAPLAAPLHGYYAAYYGLALTGAAVLLLRYRRARGPERRRMRLLALTLLAIAPVAALDVLLSALGAPGSPVIGILYGGVALLTAGIIVAGVLRYQLFDLELAARRASVYGALTLAIAAVYVAVVAVPGFALGRLIPVELAVLLTIAAALAFHPLRRKLDAVADHWAFGRPRDNAQLLMDLGAALENTVDLPALLPRVAGTVRDGLEASWVRVTLVDDDGRDLAEPQGYAGSPEEAAGPAALTMPLERAGKAVGRIECGQPRSGSYGERERELLARLAGQAATAIANLRLTAQLASSRARIVAAGDAERRRIERDIHDGVQQEVVALLTSLRLGRNQVARGERVPDAVLAEVAEDARLLLTDLRELAHGIHPPLLSDRGLVAAVRARADRLPVPAAVHAGPELVTQRLGPELEGAAYFVICEALTNVVKHAGAGSADVTLTMDGGLLQVEVRDDGAGYRTNGHRGNGVTNMRDRVEALGGRLTVETGPAGGTRVRAELPLRDGAAAEPPRGRAGSEPSWDGARSEPLRAGDG